MLYVIENDLRLGPPDAYTFDGKKSEREGFRRAMVSVALGKLSLQDRELDNDGVLQFRLGIHSNGVARDIKQLFEDLIVDEDAIGAAQDAIVKAGTERRLTVGNFDDELDDLASVNPEFVTVVGYLGTVMSFTGGQLAPESYDLTDETLDANPALQEAYNRVGKDNPSDSLTHWAPRYKIQHEEQGVSRLLSPERYYSIGSVEDGGWYAPHYNLNIPVGASG